METWESFWWLCKMRIFVIRCVKIHIKSFFIRLYWFNCTNTCVKFGNMRSYAINMRQMLWYDLCKRSIHQNKSMMFVYAAMLFCSFSCFNVNAGINWGMFILFHSIAFHSCYTWRGPDNMLILPFSNGDINNMRVVLQYAQNVIISAKKRINTIWMVHIRWKSWKYEIIYVNAQIYNIHEIKVVVVSFVHTNDFWGGNKLRHVHVLSFHCIYLYNRQRFAYICGIILYISLCFHVNARINRGISILFIVIAVSS